MDKNIKKRKVSSSSEIRNVKCFHRSQKKVESPGIVEASKFYQALTQEDKNDVDNYWDALYRREPDAQKNHQKGYQISLEYDAIKNNEESGENDDI